ncbi:hypothetical protein [Streptomyces sp. cg35]|uniref:hypothetical protein n=1 Tax=Streptomyces sp. cg35 TaxID=3421650 RepID=UPI003D17140D
MSVSAFTRPATFTPLDEHWTLTFEQAAVMLRMSADKVRRLVKYSQLNADCGIEGPLQVTDNGHSVTLQSVVAYNRQRATSSRTA